MATITVTSSPADVDGIYPVENCLEYCFDIEDLLTVAPVKATMIIGFDDAEPQVLAETFTILGKTFTVAVTGAFVVPYQVELTQVLALDNANRLADNLRKNFLFKDTEIEVTGGGTHYDVEITWCECGPIDFINDTDFSGLSFPMDLAITDGSCGDWPRGWRFIYQIYEYIDDDTKLIPICPVQSVNPIIDFDVLSLGDNVLDICIDIHNELSGRVFSTVPDCDTDIGLDDNFFKRARICYGEVFDDTTVGCGVDFGLWEESDVIRFHNGALNIEDGDFITEVPKYSHNAGLPGSAILWLTDRPENLPICLDSCAWLKIHATSTPIVGNAVEYFVRVEAYDLLGNPPSVSDSDPAKRVLTDGTIVVPVGPANLNNMMVTPLTFSAMCRYTVQLMVYDTVSTLTFGYSPKFNFPVYNNDCPCANIMFLGEKGNWEVIDLFPTKERTVQVNQTEICRNVPCNNNMQVDGRRYQILTEKKTKLKLESDWYFKDDANLRFLSIFKASESRYIKRADRYGTESFRPMLVENGSMKVWESDKKIKVNFTAIFAEIDKQPSEQ